MEQFCYLFWLFQGTTEDDRPFKFRSGIAPTLNYTGWVFDTYSWSQIIYERFIKLKNLVIFYVVKSKLCIILGHRSYVDRLLHFKP